jgi:hypothetical protein
MKIDFLEGPVTAYCLRSADATYWIFGDYHQLTDGCSSDMACMRGRVARLEQFISEEALAHPDRPLDVLLETWPLDRLDNDTQSRVFDTRTYVQMLCHFFMSSLLKEPCQTYYPNVRVHGIDARQASSAFQGIVETAAVAVEHLTTEQVEHCIQCLDLFRDEKNVQGMFDYVVRSYGVLQRIQALRSAKEKQLCSSILDRHRSSREFYQTHIERIRHALVHSHLPYLSEFFSIFMREAMNIMDANALATLLTTDRAVVFVGLEHAEIYARLLTRVGFECVWPESNQRKSGRMRQCLDFRRAPTPYFP